MRKKILGEKKKKFCMVCATPINSNPKAVGMLMGKKLYAHPKCVVHTKW
jgi:hypothetical protein